MRLAARRRTHITNSLFHRKCPDVARAHRDTVSKKGYVFECKHRSELQIAVAWSCKIAVGATGTELKKRTLTNVSKVWPTWQQHADAHAALDRAAWGWDDLVPAEVDEDTILWRRLARKGSGQGVIPRPLATDDADVC